MNLDEQELRAFFAHGYDRLVGRLDGWHRRAWAEDLVQEALVRAWERARRGETVGSLPAWVTTVATNLARSRLRREQAERRAIERLAATWPGWVPDWPGGAAEEAEVLRELVERLPRRQRGVVVLRYVADLDLASIAELLGIDVAVEADRIMLGAILSGEGELPLSGVAFEEVDERVPVTGPELPRRPRNLGFAES